MIPAKGEDAKLKFTSHKETSFNDGPTAEYIVMFNPASFAVKLQVERDSSTADGEIDGLMKFKKIQPQDYQFEFIIDGTGADGSGKKDVPEEIQKFLNVCYTYEGEQHKPSYVKIQFGSIILKTVLKSVDITYTLFNREGKPLRAKINCTFNSCSDPVLMEAKKNDNSPDLTHARKVKGSDKLIRMANTIYKKNTYYLEVARVNGLDSFRDVASDTEVYFPPVAKN